MNDTHTHHEAVIDGVRVVAEKATVPTLDGARRDAWKISREGRTEVAVLPYSIHTTPAMLEEAMRTVLRMMPFTENPDR